VELPAEATSPPAEEDVAPGIRGNEGVRTEPASIGQDEASIGPQRKARTPSTVVIGIRDLGFHQEVLDFLGRHPRIEVAGAAMEPGRFCELVAGVGPDVALACPAVTRVLARPQMGPGPAHVVVAQEMTVPVLRDAIDSGAGAVFAWPEERDELAQLISEASAARSSMEKARGRVMAVLGARGGAGTTFVATHLAAALADRGLRAVLVDLDGSFADVTVALGVPRGDGDPRTVADLLPVIEELSPEHLEDALFRHRRGFDVLLAPPSGLDMAIPPALHRAAVALLATDFDAVVLHVPHALDECARAAIAVADEVVLVCALDLFSLHGARRAMSALRLDEGHARYRVVLNRVTRAEVTAADVERVVGSKACAEVRFDPGVRRAQDRGELLPRDARRAGRDIEALAALLAPPAAGATEATDASTGPVPAPHGRRHRKRKGA
jgi:pilus assembly protein CpaE